MATINATNTKDQPALKGQSVNVNLSQAETISVLPLLALGQSCSISSSSKTGLIDFIDSRGHSFRIKPAMPVNACDSNTPGVLKINELITITL
jgi:hypothetical protein